MNTMLKYFKIVFPFLFLFDAKFYGMGFTHKANLRTVDNGIKKCEGTPM